MPPSDLLSALLKLVPTAAREHSTQAVGPRDALVTGSAPLPLSLGERLASPVPGPIGGDTGGSTLTATSATSGGSTSRSSARPFTRSVACA